jgi:hypothetical protein
VYGISLSIFCSAALVVIDCFSFCSLWKVFYFSFSYEDNSAG